jgi:hypothetical protein
MKLKMKLRVDDLQVSSFVPEGAGGVHAASYTVYYDTCGCAISDAWCVSQTGPCPGGPACVTVQYGGGETCETGPIYYC